MRFFTRHLPHRSAFYIRKREMRSYFYGDLDPQIQWEGDARAELCLISPAGGAECMEGASGSGLSRSFRKIMSGKKNGELVVTGSGKTMIAVYPAVEKGIVDFKECGKRGNFTLYERIYKSTGAGGRACLQRAG